MPADKRRRQKDISEVAEGDRSDSLGDPSVEHATVEQTVRSHIIQQLRESVLDTLEGMLVELELFRDEQRGRAGVLREVELIEGSTIEALESVRRLVGEMDSSADAIEDGFLDSVRTRLLPRMRRTTGTEIRLSVSTHWPPRLLRAPAIDLYRIIQEGLQNAVRHGGARMVRVGLRVNSTRQQLVLTVTDDGRGISATSAGGSGGLGLVGLRERAALLGGRLDVMPRRGGGTTIRAVIPRGNVVPLEGGA